MVAKAVLLFCAAALLVQHISAQCMAAAPCTGAWNALSYAEAPLGASGAPAFAPAAAYGGGFQIISTSPLAVTGVSLTSENAYEGPLSVCGNVPFLGAVALDGCMPTTGSGSITYGCGNGQVAMISEDIPYAASYGYGAPQAYEAAPGYGYAYNRGCGSGH